MIFSVLLNVFKNSLYKGHGLRIAGNLISVFFPMLQGEIGRIILACIYSCGSQLVAYTLNGILIGHKRLDGTFLICPIFNVVSVSSLVMEPGLAHTGIAAASTYGRSVALVVLNAFKKFGRAELG